MPVYVVGDAGGFADAMTGEGIYYALESGRLAGYMASQAHLGKTSHHAYYSALKRNILVDTKLSYWMAKVLYPYLGRMPFIIQNSLVWRPIVQGFLDGTGYYKSIQKWVVYTIASYQNRCRREGRKL
jgi:flavin-dependent dehydrogenase